MPKDSFGRLRGTVGVVQVRNAERYARTDSSIIRTAGAPTMKPNAGGDGGRRQTMRSAIGRPFESIDSSALFGKSGCHVASGAKKRQKEQASRLAGTRHKARRFPARIQKRTRRAGGQASRTLGFPFRCSACRNTHRESAADPTIANTGDHEILLPIPSVMRQSHQKSDSQVQRADICGISYQTHRPISTVRRCPRTAWPSRSPCNTC